MRARTDSEILWFGLLEKFLVRYGMSRINLSQILQQLGQFQRRRHPRQVQMAEFEKALRASILGVQTFRFQYNHAQILSGCFTIIHAQTIRRLGIWLSDCRSSISANRSFQPYGKNSLNFDSWAI